MTKICSAAVANVAQLQSDSIETWQKAYVQQQTQMQSQTQAQPQTFIVGGETADPVQRLLQVPETDWGKMTGHEVAAGVRALVRSGRFGESAVLLRVM